MSSDGEEVEQHYLDLNHWHKDWQILGFQYQTSPFVPQEGKDHGS